MIFHTKHHISFDPIDPLGDGLGDAIAAEQREPEAMTDLSDPLDGAVLSQWWGTVLEEVHQDPDWFDFAED